MGTLDAHLNEFPYVLLAEGAAPATPATGFVRLYVKADGLLYWKDDAGTEYAVGQGDTAGHLADTTDAHDASAISFTPAGTIAATDVQAAIEEVASEAGGGGSAIVAYDYNVYTSGDIALTSTSPVAVTGPTDLTVAASTGDVVCLSVSALANNATAASIAFDFATIVAGAPVNYISSGTGTPITIGVMGWYIPNNAIGGASGGYYYVVQAGDISGGNVVFRLYARVSANRTLSAAAATPLWTQATNFGQP